MSVRGALPHVSSPTDRTAWLASHFGNPPNDPAARVQWLARGCRKLRAHGIAGHWTYDLPLHRELISILEAERAALAATESLPVPHRRRLRAA